MTDEDDDTPNICRTELLKLGDRGATIEQLEGFAEAGVIPPKFLYARKPITLAVGLVFEKGEPIDRLAKSHCIWRCCQYTAVPPFEWFIYPLKKRGRRKLVLFFGIDSAYEAAAISQAFKKMDIFPKWWTEEQEHQALGKIMREMESRGEKVDLKEGGKLIDWKRDPRFRPKPELVK